MGFEIIICIMIMNSTTVEFHCVLLLLANVASKSCHYNYVVKSTKYVFKETQIMAYTMDTHIFMF